MKKIFKKIICRRGEAEDFSKALFTYQYYKYPNPPKNSLSVDFGKSYYVSFAISIKIINIDFSYSFYDGRKKERNVRKLGVFVSVFKFITILEFQL